MPIDPELSDRILRRLKEVESDLALYCFERVDAPREDPVVVTLQFYREVLQRITDEEFEKLEAERNAFVASFLKS